MMPLPGHGTRTSGAVWLYKTTWPMKDCAPDGALYTAPPGQVG